MKPNSEVRINDLSLKISERGLPFDLVGPELRFGPEIWAWQFLRLNDEYRTDFQRAQSNELDSEDRQTRIRRHGLIGWMDPAIAYLPEAIGPSWFQPLKEPVEAMEWEADLYPDDILPRSQEPSWGYGSLPSTRPDGDDGISTVVWYAIDCSIPPAGQLAYVRDSANYYLDWFKEEGLKKPRGREASYSLLELDKCRYFDSNGFSSAAGAKGTADDPSIYWRAIRVDVFSAISKQIDSYQKPLEAVYQRFADDGIAEQPFLERLRFFFPDLGVDYGEHNSDGFALKALVIVEQLSRKGLSDEEIAEFVTKNSCYKSWTTGTAKNWASDLALRTPIYRKHAAKFIDAGYRWLVRAQKP